MQLIITFPSVYHAFRARSILLENGIDIELISIPRQLSGSCEGLAARIDNSKADYAESLLNSAGVVIMKKIVI